MSRDEKKNSPLVVLAAYRDNKRKESYIQKSLCKTGTLRDLLSEGLRAFNRGDASERGIIAFALADMLRFVSHEDMDHFKDIVRNVSRSSPQD